MRGLFFAALLLLGACPSPSTTDAGTDDAGMNGALKPCLERPDDALAPPGSQLPCTLLPPSFGQ